MGLLWFVLMLIVLIWLLGRKGAPDAGYVERAIDIQASSQDVWALLMDGENFADWHPSISGYHLNGGPKVGARVELDMPGEPGPILKLVRSNVIAFEPGHKMVWHSRLGWLANFIHEFEVMDVDGTNSRFVQREAFTGILCWLWALAGKLDNQKAIETIVGHGHEEMNIAMKQQLESENGNRNNA